MADDKAPAQAIPGTLQPLIVEYLRERRRRGELGENSANEFRYRLATFARSFGTRPLSDMGERAVEEWLESIGHLKPASRHAYFSSAKVFLRWMVRREHLHRDPTLELGRIKQPRSVPRALPAADVAALLRSRPGARDQAILWLMVGLALRCCEVADLEVADYDAHAGTLFIVGKSDNERVLPVPDVVASALSLHLRERGSFAGPLILSLTDQRSPLRARTLSMMVSRWMFDCGVKHHAGDGVAAHSLRHTCASDVLDECGDLRVVQAMLGHANIATTSRYLRRASLGQMLTAMEGRSYLWDASAPAEPSEPSEMVSLQLPCSLREHLDAGGDLSPMAASGDKRWGYLAEAIIFDPAFDMDRERSAAQMRMCAGVYLEREYPVAMAVQFQQKLTSDLWIGEMYDDEELRQRVIAMLPADLVAHELEMIERAAADPDLS